MDMFARRCGQMQKAISLILEYRASNHRSYMWGDLRDDSRRNLPAQCMSFAVCMQRITKHMANIAGHDWTFILCTPPAAIGPRWKGITWPGSLARVHIKLGLAMEWPRSHAPGRSDESARPMREHTGRIRLHTPASRSCGAKLLDERHDPCSGIGRRYGLIYREISRYDIS